MSLYIDTSALAKWYIAESDSDRFDDFIRDHPGAHISRLTVLELKCLLARRRRNREITSRVEAEAFSLFESHVRDGFLVVLAMHDLHFVTASQFLADAAGRSPLRTLDALHLAVARGNGDEAIVTADSIMVSAAKALKFQIHAFQ